MIGVGFFILFFIVFLFLDQILIKVDKKGFDWSMVLTISALSAASIELGFRLLLRAWPFN